MFISPHEDNYIWDDEEQSFIPILQKKKKKNFRATLNKVCKIFAQNNLLNINIYHHYSKDHLFKIILEKYVLFGLLQCIYISDEQCMSYYLHKRLLYPFLEDNSQLFCMRWTKDLNQTHSLFTSFSAKRSLINLHEMNVSPLAH